MQWCLLSVMVICSLFVGLDVRAGEPPGFSVGEGGRLILPVSSGPSRTWSSVEAAQIVPPSDPAAFLQQNGGEQQAVLTALLGVFVQSLLASAAAAFMRSFRRERHSPGRRKGGLWAMRGRIRAEQKSKQLFNAAGALLVRAHRLVSNMGTMAPLQKALRRELALVARRLLTVAPTVSEPSEAPIFTGSAPNWERLQKQLRTSIQELNRLVEIAEAAGARAPDGAAPLPLPASKDEAYEVLGINAHSGEAALEKLVEALRQCWHPGFARDEADRRHREERIKQIDAAWEIIVTETSPPVQLRRAASAGRSGWR